MKSKKLTAGLCGLILSIFLNTAAFANGVDGAFVNLAGENDSVITNEMPSSLELTKRGDSDMKAKYKASLEKWNALPDAQKEEIYRLKDVTIDVECQIIDKYLEFGIIDNETATALKAKKAEYKSEMRKSGKMPGHGKKFKSDKKK